MDLSGPELEAWLAGYAQAAATFALGVDAELKDKWWDGYTNGLLEGIQAGTSKKREGWIYKGRRKNLVRPGNGRVPS
ncbi:hypothetical protein ABZS66_37310 [Dactylosporangium sp. NPDC005572]|uniref:hypothetical protein n=1 Tax=Dactylosporangium sp. NPDC005572 TaxID=3156889 RepID=UPI0033AE83BC